MDSSSNRLYYGDNLDVLRRHVPPSSVDLVYLDPPLSSEAYTLREPASSVEITARLNAPSTNWEWNRAAIEAYEETVNGGGSVATILSAARTVIGPSNGLAYLAMLAPRLVAIRRALKSSGSLYVHSDSSISQYLKMLLDAVFGPGMCRSEIIWKRSADYNESKRRRRRYERVHDVIFFYTKSSEWTWNPLSVSDSDRYAKTKYRHVEPGTGRRYRLDDLTVSGESGSESRVYEVMGVTRRWRYSRERMQKLIEEGRVVLSEAGAVPRYKRYLDEMPGIPPQDVWTDIDPVYARDSEWPGYPGQKPVRLLERIIATSSNRGDTVLDPFCGSGTALSAAQRLGRSWIGMEVDQLSVAIVKYRLQVAFGRETEYLVLGEPRSPASAERFAASDPGQFGLWVLGQLGAIPGDVGKRSDRGMDGRLLFHDEGVSGPTKQVIVSVKGGGEVNVSMVNDLVRILSQAEAQIGVLVSQREPTPLMRKEAAAAGYYTSPINGVDYPRVQLLTVADILMGRRIAYPALMGANVGFARRPTRRGTEMGDEL